MVCYNIRWMLGSQYRKLRLAGEPGNPPAVEAHRKAWFY
jgi:hypothetical protein